MSKTKEKQKKNKEKKKLNESFKHCKGNPI